MKVTVNQLKGIIEEINSETIIRVYPRKMTFISSKFGEVIVQASSNRMDDYRDADHVGKQGRGFIEWRNGDFSEPVTVEQSTIMWLNQWAFAQGTLPEEVSFGRGVITAEKYLAEVANGRSGQGLYPLAL